MNLIKKLVVVTVLHVSIIAGQLYEGDVCLLKDGNSGICKYFSHCAEAISNIRIGIIPENCGFKGTQVIVCCQQAVKVTPKPTTPVTQKSTTVTPRPPIITQKPTTVIPKPTTPVTPKPTTVTPKPTLPANTKNRLPGEISDQKCLEYSAFIWSVGLNPTLFVGGGDIRINDCPFTRQELVVGGVAATKREFPHMVQFGYDGSDGLTWTCGGSLISEQYILTAAHCLSARSKGDAKYARMGLVNLRDNDTMQKYNIAEVIPHPQYEAPSHYNDIGLVKLKKPVEMNTWVRPACLYTKNHSPWSHVIASGWGKTDFAAGSQSEVLLRVILELFGQPTCNKTFKKQIGTDTLMDGIKDDVMICAGHSKEIKDTCEGDSGGPLQVYRNGENDLSCMYEVVGVTSFGRACGLAVNVPAVYTRVSYYTKWIEDIVWPTI